MSLENLHRIGQLKPHAVTRAEIGKLLAAARRNLEDAVKPDNSTETRFDCAYKALMQCALVAMQANGYRPDTKRPGHHVTVLQSLPLTLGVEGSRVMVLDKLREKRNLSDYMGADLDEVSTEACIREARRLLQEVSAWLKAKHPELA
ncbi:MAG: DNA-binding protein [Nevskiales bacterium]